MSDPAEQARYIMIGGFLGAGKTTALEALARHAADRGLRAGLITNDQSRGLVDTSILRRRGFDVEEITGGCFCCRFRSLQEAAAKLTADTRPDVFIAEPVGSCTDLVATVCYPLRRIYGDRFTIAPLSVLVDPRRAARILEIEAGRSFSPKVVYVYRKQVEEADRIVINKCDTVDEELRNRLEAALRREFPETPVYSCSAKRGDGLETWFEDILDNEGSTGPAMIVDYDAYAEGEALLGWLNATVEVTSESTFDADALLLQIGARIRERLAGDAAEIAHLKMTLDARDGTGQLAAVSLVGTDEAVDLRESLLDRADRGELIINLRAEADPELLRDATEAALGEAAAAGVKATIEHIECFRPARPVPTHRLGAAGTAGGMAP